MGLNVNTESDLAIAQVRPKVLRHGTRLDGFFRSFFRTPSKCPSLGYDWWDMPLRLSACPEVELADFGLSRAVLLAILCALHGSGGGPQVLAAHGKAEPKGKY